MLVVAPQPFFSPRGTPFSVYYRTQVASALGHEVDILTYGQGADVDIPNCRIIRIPAFNWLGPVRTGPSLHKLFLDGFMIVWTVALLLRHRYRVVHAHEEAVFWCRWFKPLFRYRLVYDMHSSLPQQLHNFAFTRSRVLHALFEKLENGALRSADAVCVICPALKSQASELTSDEKIVLIENSLCEPIKFAGSDSSDVHSEAAQSSHLPGLERWIASRNPEKVISYAGTLETYQGIDRLLEAFALLAARVPEASLLILGGLPREVDQFRGLSDSLGLGGAVYFTGLIPHFEAQRLLDRAAAAVSPRLTGNNTPMKIYQLMADGVPIVATRIESHTQVLTDDIAILCEATAEGLAGAMQRALEERDGARAMAGRAQDWYAEHYSRNAYVTKVSRLLALVA